MPIIPGSAGRTLEFAGAPGAGTDEVQTLTPSGLPTGGTFQISFGGMITADIDWEATAAETLAALELLGTIGSGGLGVTAVKSLGTLTMATEPGNTDTVVVGGITYQFLTTLVDVANNVLIGANVAASKVNLVAAINSAGGTPGTTHFTSQVANPLVTVATFAGDDMVATARQVGVAGDAIATTASLQSTDDWAAAVLGSGADIVVTFDGSNVAKKVQPLMVLAENAFTGGTTPGMAIAETTPGVDAAFRSGGKGQLVTDTTNGELYINTGTANEPTWTKVGTQS